MENATLLVVDDEESVRHVLSMNLQRRGYRIVTAEDGVRALAMIEEERPDLVICDVKMPGMDGLALLSQVKRRNPSLPVIMMTAYGTSETVMQAVRDGADDYCSKPIRTDELLFSIEKALERLCLIRENELLRKRLNEQEPMGELIGDSQSMKNIYRIIRKIAPTGSTVLITGESGTGKELVARSLHQLSDRSGGPFVPLNCAALPAEIFESELFGHTKGAFTGAVAETQGLFHVADGGTLFLDEVAEIPPQSQHKLLRVLQDNEIRKVGGKHSVKVDVRLVAATEKHLEQLVTAGEFSAGLYYRLRVVPIHLPPLRERPEDIPMLAGAFLEQFNARHDRRVPVLTPRQIGRLMRYHWPGNVRELQNMIERAVLMAEGESIPDSVFPGTVEKEELSVVLPPHMVRLPETSAAVQAVVERTLIMRALDQEAGNRTRAAKLLGISHRALLYKLKDHSIK
ncbi:sigma-54-dependent Fis family transcriptional regulator [bacterium]|nr:sigma-54-dependent Fis family transcriptional regulator [candidate division CSSED10-310 bacterium]